MQDNAIQEAIEHAMIDSGASRNFVKSARGMELTGLSDKQVMAADRGSLSATHTALLPTRALSKGARESYVVPGVQESLVSVPVFSSNGYTTVFLPGNGGVKVYKQDDLSMVEKSPPVLQGWRDARGLFMVPIANKATISKSLDVQESANSVYELPSTKEVVRFLHAALGFPTKATLLTAAKHGNLVTFPGLTPENISRHFPESEETQKGHIKRTRQGRMQCSIFNRAPESNTKMCTYTCMMPPKR